MTGMQIRFLIVVMCVSKLLGATRIEVFGIAKCPDTSKFYKTQFLPFLKTIGTIPEEISIDFHPVPVSYSITENGVVKNSCLHGNEECRLNKLQLCTKKLLSKNETLTEIVKKVTCIQGQRAYADATKCLNKMKKRIMRCARSQEGEKLLSNEHDTRAVIAPKSDWLPWIQIDGQRSLEAEGNFKNVVCGLNGMENVRGCLTNKKNIKRS